MTDRTRRKKTWGARWPLAAAATAAFLVLGTTATQARADSNFSRGFEDQMGRILAYEAVQVGKQVLFQGVAAPYPAAHSAHHASHPSTTSHVVVHYRPHKHRAKHVPVRRVHPHYVPPRHDHWYRSDRSRVSHRERQRREHEHDRYCYQRH